MLGAQTIVIFGILLVACGGASKQTTLGPQPQPRAADTLPRAPEPVQASTHVAVSDDLATQCALRVNNPEQAPRFDYDAADLQADDRAVLQQVAECLLRGPLQGRTVKLVGRADPRGTSEYNLGLGTRRAESVLSYLTRLGVPQGQLTATTRGSLDAGGTDDASWRRDRRVDLQLGN
jgi:peptidoglycan-associated lipoprotein